VAIALMSSKEGAGVIPLTPSDITTSENKVRTRNICERHLMFHALWVSRLKESIGDLFIYSQILFLALINHILRRLTGPTSFESEQTKTWTIRTVGLRRLVQSYEEGVTSNSKTLCVLVTAMTFGKMSFQCILGFLWR